MTVIKLFHAPGACSRVTMTALEEAGAVFEDVMVNILAGDQKKPEYLAINPKGKVPAIVIDGQFVTENAAILILIDRLFPDAKLLPPATGQIAAAQVISDLVWCASGLHPLVRSIRMPNRLTNGDETSVRAKGVEQLAIQAAPIDMRLSRQPWYYGEAWAIMDVYIHWMFTTAAAGGFDLAPYPNIQDHAKRVRARESFQRVLAREMAALERAGVRLPPGISL